ncbi:MAG: glycoside hydrolase family 95 protein [Ruminococcaceae bacterium]|nr:glycoside hydrolase family 95 protein [Oscillospiraceae bacterium]
MTSYNLFLANEAYNWENATPVGCGKIGAMLFGGVKKEIIQFNEEKIWSGGPSEICSDGFYEKFQEVRNLLRTEGVADDLAQETLYPYFGRLKSYETAGSLIIAMLYDNDDPTVDYRRDLDLINGVASVTYKKGNVNYERTLFASYPAQMIAMQLSSDVPHSISFTATYTRSGPDEDANFAVVNGDINVSSHDNFIKFNGETRSGGHTFNGLLRFDVCGGSIKSNQDGSISVLNADRVCIYMTIKTEGEAHLPDISSFDRLMSEHTEDFSSLMTRADISYEYDKSKDEIPVNKRLAAVKAGGSDIGLVNLCFQFGRYLLISSSRGDSLPANLQGVWSNFMRAPWNCDYHTNINLQMNYWHAETANLSECAVPLFNYINNYLLEGGERAARDFYHCRGAVLHHISDIYGFAGPADGLWGLWPMGGAWLCYSLWEHYLFDPNPDYLRETAYPYIEACTKFFLDYMFEDDNGYLGTGPSTSPENRFMLERNGVKGPVFLCLSPTMDIQIVRGLFEMYIKTEEVLNINPEQKQEVEVAYSKLPPMKIGARGQLQEWAEDYEEEQPGHRHISHSFALYPGWEINRNTPDLMDAIDTTLKLRLASGGGHTGWSCAWLMNLYARLGQGDNAGDMITKLFTNSMLDNLFDRHPPFQIDGNFGAAAAFAEMLIQSHTDVIELLPALPSDQAYANGSFEGLRARGGITVSAEWSEGKIVLCSLLSNRDQTVKLLINGKIIEENLEAGTVKDILF